MSIAVSAAIFPSRLLFAMVCTMSAMVAAAGVAIAFRAVGILSPSVSALVGMACVFAAVFGFYHGSSWRKTIHIDISGEGAIRLSEVGGERPCISRDRPHLTTNAQLVRLLAESTIWSQMMLLRLQDESGKTMTVPILPDSVSRDSFRALSVACRWIAVNGDRPDRKNS